MRNKGTRLLFLSTVCVFAVCIAAFFAPKGLAAGGKKPGPEPIWGAKIFDYKNLIGMGEEYLYKSGDPYIRVTVQKSSTVGVVARSTIHFFIYASDPVEKWAAFQGLSLIPEFSIIGTPGPAGACGFPDSNGGVLPDCFLNFFNSRHPKPGYEHLLFYFVVDADIEDGAMFPIGTTVPWTGGGAVTIYLWNSFDPLSATDSQPYESVTASLKNLCSESPKGYWIKRVDANTWDITIEQQVFDLTQFYSWAGTSTGRNGKPITTVTSYQPFAGKGELSYKIRLIKNPG